MIVAQPAHGAVFRALGGARDARTAVRIAAQAGVSDHAANGALRALAHRDLAQSTKANDPLGGPIYWTLTELGEYVRKLAPEPELLPDTSFEVRIKDQVLRLARGPLLKLLCPNVAGFELARLPDILLEGAEETVRRTEGLEWSHRHARRFREAIYAHRRAIDAAGEVKIVDPESVARALIKHSADTALWAMAGAHSRGEDPGDAGE